MKKLFLSLMVASSMLCISCTNNNGTGSSSGRIPNTELMNKAFQDANWRGGNEPLIITSYEEIDIDADGNPEYLIKSDYAKGVLTAVFDNNKMISCECIGFNDSMEEDLSVDINSHTVGHFSMNEGIEIVNICLLSNSKVSKRFCSTMDVGSEDESHWGIGTYSIDETEVSKEEYEAQCPKFDFENAISLNFE